MAHPAYGTEHRRIRKALMAQLRRRGSAPCPICTEPMIPGLQQLDLHHSTPERKHRGLPGDVLAHTDCNRGQPMRGRDIIAARKARDAADDSKDPKRAWGRRFAATTNPQQRAKLLDEMPIDGRIW
jgi:hypothetical protein